MRAIGLMLAFGLAMGLAGCGKPATPLSHAIDAFHAGDQAALTAARQEAAEALKMAIPADSDMCMLTGPDIRKYSEAARIAKLDNGELLRQPEEEKLLYALKVAAPSPKITDDPRLMNSPLYRAMTDGSSMKNCKQLPDTHVVINAAALAAVDEDNNSEIARSDALKTWIADLKQRHGAAFESKMRSAANHLSDIGYSAPWPAKTEFYGEDAPGTFAEVQEKLRARDADDAFRDKSKTTFEEMQDRMRRQRN